MRVFLLLPVVVALALLAGHPTQGQDEAKPYDFRDTEAYRALSDEDRERLEQVQRDFALIWGALDMYVDTRGGEPPEKLSDLEGHHLLELPLDPFSPGAKEPYGYRKGAPGNRAWCISSQGLSGCPYLAARGNVGLYVCKGTWISGVNPTWQR